MLNTMYMCVNGFFIITSIVLVKMALLFTNHPIFMPRLRMRVMAIRTRGFEGYIFEAITLSIKALIREFGGIIIVQFLGRLLQTEKF